MVRGRRSERVNGGRTLADRAVDGRRARSPLVAERHVLLKADKVKTLWDDLVCEFLLYTRIANKQCRPLLMCDNEFCTFYIIMCCLASQR